MWIGTRKQVYHGYAIYTKNGLTRNDLYINKYGGMETNDIHWINTLPKPLYIFLSATIFSKILILSDTNEIITNNNSNNLSPLLLYFNPDSNTIQATRQMTHFSTTGCVYWQLHYIIMYQFWKHHKTSFNNLIINPMDIFSSNNQPIIKSILQIFNDIIHISSPLYSILVRGDNSIDSITKLDINGECTDTTSLFKTISHLENLKQDGIWTYDENGIQNYCLCLHLNTNAHPVDDCINGPGRILHYFTLIHFRDNDKWFLNSSYGCSLTGIKSPQTTVPLDIDEFNEFLNIVFNISTSLKNQTILETFIDYYINYFLSNQQSFYLTRDEAMDRVSTGQGPSNWATASVQKPNFGYDNNEIRSLLDNPCINGLTISWIVPYNNIVENYIKK
jgi:hypothetical protein